MHALEDMMRPAGERRASASPQLLAGASAAAGNRSSSPAGTVAARLQAALADAGVAGDGVDDEVMAAITGGALGAMPLTPKELKALEKRRQSEERAREKDRKKVGGGSWPGLDPIHKSIPRRRARKAGPFLAQNRRHRPRRRLQRPPALQKSLGLVMIRRLCRVCVEFVYYF